MALTLRRILCLVIVVALAAGWQADPPTGTPGAGAVVPATAGPSAIPSGAQMAVVQIEGPILYDYQLDSLKARVDRALAGGADVIVFELDTPGGDMYLAIEYSKYIKSLQVPTVAWVNTRAYSAGSLLASACDEMVMSRNASVGDCAPVMMGQSMGDTERAKALSPLLAEFRDNAEENYGGASGSDYAVFHAMCVLNIPVYRVRHTQTGEVRLVNAVDLAVLVDGMSPGDALQSVPNAADPAAGIAGSGTSGASQAGGANAGVEDLDLRQVAGPSLVIGNDQLRGDWELLAQAHDGGTLLTYSEKEAARFGLSRATLSSMPEIQQHYQAASVGLVKPTWSEAIAWFLLNPWVRGVLVVLLLIGGFIEYVSPGLILPGALAAVALLLLIGAPFFVGLASIWHIIVVVAGLLILLFELFTLSTGGLLAIVGLAMILTGLALAAVQSTPSGLPAPGTSGQLLTSAISMGAGLIIAVPAFVIIVRYFGDLPGLKRFVLDDPPSHRAVNAAGEPIDMPAQRITGDESVGAGWVKVGMAGVVSSTGLRPGGRIEIEDQLLDVTSTGGWVEPGTPVRVLAVHGNVVTVEPADVA